MESTWRPLRRAGVLARLWALLIYGDEIFVSRGPTSREVSLEVWRDRDGYVTVAIDHRGHGIQGNRSPTLHGAVGLIRDHLDTLIRES